MLRVYSILCLLYYSLPHPGLVLWMRETFQRLHLPGTMPPKNSPFSRACRTRPLLHLKEEHHSHAHPIVCNFPADSARVLVCDWIAGTPGGAIQVRDLSLPTQPTPLVRLKNRLQNRHARNLLSSKFAGLQEDGNKTTSAQRWSGPNSGARTVPRE